MENRRHSVHRSTTVASSRDAGLTLMEVVIAMMVLAIMAVATLSILLSAQSSSVDSRNRVAASNLAAREIDLVREKFSMSSAGPVTVATEGIVTNGNPLPGGSTGQDLEIDGTPYTVVRSSAWNVTGTGQSACEGGVLVQHPTLIVTVTVTWPGMGSTLPITNSTILSPDRAVGVPSTSAFAAIMVKDSKGQPNPGRRVTVSSVGETRTSLTDISGCAVVTLSPPAAGADYTAVFPDAGFVDMGNTPSPERSIGLIKRGELASNIEISLERAASVTLRITGDGVTAADVAGTSLSLYRSEAAGNNITQVPLTGLETVVGNLWPTQYAAFFGEDLPPSLDNTTDVEVGGTAVIEVPFSFAQFVVDGLPAAGEVIAVADGGTCTTAGARVVNPAAGQLPLGTWSFFLRSPAIGCSPGPTSVSLFPGPNAAVTWEETTLTVLQAPVGQGAIWAVSSEVGAACSSGSAVLLAADGPTVGPAALPAGNWHVFAMADAGGQPAGGACVSAGLVAVPYAATTSYTWVAGNASVRVTGITGGGATGWRVLATKGTIITGCTTAQPSGSIVLTATAGGTNTPTAVVGSLGQGDWRFYRQRTNGWSNTNRCAEVPGGPFTVNWAPSYSLDFATGTWVTP